MGQICNGYEAMDIFFYDGTTIQQITSDGLPEEVSNQGAQLNDNDTIVWTRYDFCVEPWESDIIMYSDGVTVQLTDDESANATVPHINNLQQICWQTNVPGPNKGIVLWENGSASLFSDWGGGPRLNDKGDMCFYRWYEAESTYQMWLYRKGNFYQLSDDPYWNVDGDINNRGEVAWQSGNYPWSDIRLLKRKQPGGHNGAVEKAALTAQPVNP